MPLEQLRKMKDSVAGTFIVAGALCVVCALVVSASATVLKTIQEKNVDKDRKRNLLAVTGFPAEDIAKRPLETFNENFDVTIIDLETGEEAIEECHAAMAEAGKKFPIEETVARYDQVWASRSKNKAVADPVDKENQVVGFKFREKFSPVYILKNDDGSPKTYVFPVRGYGLWSMMYGYLAVKPDLQTVEGITFYEQAETPGLGGEIKSARFQAQWPGKLIYDGEDVGLRVIKNAPSDDYSIDALTGATITSNGVSTLVSYWLGPNGFLPYIKNQQGGKLPNSEAASNGENLNHVSLAVAGEFHGE